MAPTSWNEVDRWRVREFHRGTWIEVAFEKFGETKRSPYRLRCIELDRLGPGRNYEYFVKTVERGVALTEEFPSLVRARESARLRLTAAGSRLDGRWVVCEASVELPGWESVPWPGPSPKFHVETGSGPAFDRMLEARRELREAQERGSELTPEQYRLLRIDF